jgi:nucleoside triphosphate pyrophosphatase
MDFLKDIQQYTIILASASPRRHMLLKGLGLDFEVISLDVNETYPADKKREGIAEYLAELKSNAFPEEKLLDNTLLITADTIVVQEDKILHKPKDKQDAIRILSKLSNSMHEVITGVCIRTKDKKKIFHSISKVYFKQLTQQEIEYYIDTCQPYDKAGSYGIQEWIGYIGINSIEGSYFNVMGLPTQALYVELQKFIY